MARKKRHRPPTELEEAIRRFPKVVKAQERRALEQKRFLKKTFGALVKQLAKEQNGK